MRVETIQVEPTQYHTGCQLFEAGLRLWQLFEIRQSVLLLGHRHGTIFTEEPGTINKALNHDTILSPDSSATVSEKVALVNEKFGEGQGNRTAKNGMDQMLLIFEGDWFV